MSRVLELLRFHGIGEGVDRRGQPSRRNEARELYRELSSREISEIVAAAIDHAQLDEFAAAEPLCFLACFRPGCLSTFHRHLIEKRILYPSVIYHEAARKVAEELLRLAAGEDQHREFALAALEWIDNHSARDGLISAHGGSAPYTHLGHDAGWEFTETGKRRELFSKNAHPMHKPPGLKPLSTVGTGIRSEETCPWCHRMLTILLQIDDLAMRFPGLSMRQARIVTCSVCCAFGNVFSKSARWHPENRRPEYLPPDRHEWDEFPQTPLVAESQTRHYLEGANWCILPVSFSQVGGLPSWIQEPDYPTCPDCSRTMLFVGQISNEDFLEFAEGIYYCFFCPSCDVSATSYQQT